MLAEQLAAQLETQLAATQSPLLPPMADKGDTYCFANYMYKKMLYLLTS